MSALKSVFAGGVSCLALVVSSYSAFAQDGVEEMIVTESRREESLQKVPLTATAISAETLERANVTNVREVGKLAPALFIGTG